MVGLSHQRVPLPKPSSCSLQSAPESQADWQLACTKVTEDQGTPRCAADVRNRRRLKEGKFCFPTIRLFRQFAMVSDRKHTHCSPKLILTLHNICQVPETDDVLKFSVRFLENWRTIAGTPPDTSTRISTLHRLHPLQSRL